ncbi:MAG: RNA methyltransferase [Spirochaetaceae bacterium]|jgi:TrmH RNA methyltransferase|nr:RNA methyltransferase [Spirochaetaceae bacterium]
MLNRLTDELAVCGLNAVKALGTVHPERINRFFLREDRLSLFTRLCKILAERKRPYKICEDEELEKICKSRYHQGVVAMIHAPRAEGVLPEELSAWASGGKTALLLCDIENDHNLGALIRCAAFFDASPIILTPGSSALTTSACRVAEGGVEHVEFRSVRNPGAFLQSASKLLVTIGTDPRARIRITDLPRLIKDRFPRGRAGVILAMGNEEAGLPQELKEQCTLLARIPGTGAIESLNVAQAAALFLQELYER